MIELSKLRKKHKNLGFVNGIFLEDVYFSKLIRKNYKDLFPSMEECDKFAIESWGDYTKAIGIHGTDKYYTKPNFFKEVFEYIDRKNKN